MKRIAIILALTLFVGAFGACAQDAVYRFVNVELAKYNGKWAMEDGVVVMSDTLGTKGLSEDQVAAVVAAGKYLPGETEAFGPHYFRTVFDFRHPADNEGSVVFTYNSACYVSALPGRMIVRLLVYGCDTGKNKGRLSANEVPYSLSKWYPNKKGKKSRNIATGHEFVQMLGAMDALLEYYSCSILKDAYGAVPDADSRLVNVFAAEVERSYKQFGESGMEL